MRTKKPSRLEVSWDGDDLGLDINKAVQQAIAHRMKLGSLPRSTYDKYPLVDSS